MGTINCADSLALKPVRISFEIPPADRGCGGKRTHAGPRHPFCLIECQRIDKPGPQIEAAMSVVRESVDGVMKSFPQCLNHIEHANTTAGAVSRGASVSADQGGVCAESNHGANCAPLDKGPTPLAVGPSEVGAVLAGAHTGGAAS